MAGRKFPGFEKSENVKQISFSLNAEIYSLATKMREGGSDVEMALCVGQPDFLPPKRILDATKNAVDRGFVKYTANTGMSELRKALANDLKKRKGLQYVEDSVLVTPSGQMAIYLVLKALLNPGDEVVIPAPYFTNYPEMVKLVGATPVFIDRSPDNNYLLTAAQLEEALSPRTKMFLFCNPCNPTGAFHDEHHLLELAKVLNKPEYSHVCVAADEMYERIVFNDQVHKSFASLDGFFERTIYIGGFSKAYSMTGYRIGFLASSDPEFVQWCLIVLSQTHSSTNSLAQHAAIAALKCPESELQPLYKELEHKRDFIVEKLSEIPHLTIPQSSGAFYVFPDVSYYLDCKMVSDITNEPVDTTVKLCYYLLKHFKVALVPGEVFGGKSAIRLCYAASREQIERACKRLGDGLASLKRAD